MISHLRWIAGLIMIAGIAFFLSFDTSTPVSTTASLPQEADSTMVAQLTEKADNAGENQALVLFSHDDATALLPEERDAINETAEKLGGPPIANDAGTAILVPITVEDASATETQAAVEKLRETASNGVPDTVTAQATGPAAIQADLAGVFDGANLLLLGVTAAIVAVLLIITYRSPILWIIPLLVIGIADRVTATAFPFVVEALGLTWNESTGGITSVLVFGAGTNYALLLISRYRDELYDTSDRFRAMGAALRPTIATISPSAVTVILGVLCLLLSSAPTTRALGVAGTVGISIAWVFAVTVLPGVLVLFGRWIFWPARPTVGDKPAGRLWEKIAKVPKARPRVLIAVSLLIIGLCSLGAVNIKVGLDQSDQFVDTPESIAAADDLSEAFPEQSATPAQIATPVDSREETERALNPWSITPGEQVDGYQLLAVSGADTEELRTALQDTEALVGGPDAELVDEENAAAHDRLVIFPLVLFLVLIALIVMLRALVAPLIMVATVFLTNIAALGAGWWVSYHIAGFDRFDSSTPLYAYVFLVALGVDYTIFLITRTKEEARRVPTATAVLIALTRTGGVITSAGILLAAVFAALGVLPLVALAQIGIIIFIGVLLDTLLVRTLLVPSVVQLLGERFWWPKKTPPPAATAEVRGVDACPR